MSMTSEIDTSALPDASFNPKLADLEDFWSDNQRAIFDFVVNGTGNAVVVAVAGAGKSSTMVKAASMMEGGAFLTAFNKHAAADLQSKLKQQGVGSNVRAGTMHGAGFSTLRYGRKSMDLRVDAYKVADIYNDLLCDGVGREWHRNKPFAPFVTSMVSMAKQRCIGVRGHAAIDNEDAWTKMMERFDITRQLPEPAGSYYPPMPELIEWCQKVLNASNREREVIDFDDMIYQVLVDNLRPYQQDWLVIDEAQDTNPARRALAMRMLKDGGRLIAVGDPKQAIYGFTGADNDSLDRIGKTFSCVELPLTVSYRCPKRVVEHAQQWVSHIQAAPSAPEGEVSEIESEEFWNMAEAGGLSHKDAAVCRYNKPLVSTCLAMIRMGLPAKIEGREIGENLIKLANRWKRVKTMTALRDKLKEYLDREYRKALEKGRPESADSLRDQVETLLVLCDRAEELGLEKDGLISMIRDMFGDGVKGVFTLCSVHKSKGLEWDRVFLIDRKEYMPSPFATQAWMYDQEINLIYVAITRAKRALVEVNGLGEPLRKRKG
jgi:superfamily I DNA/RNA helicase